MASRRDELNAYTFAKRRLVAQFLQPNPSGTEEGAPKPLRAVMPGAIVAVVVLAVFGAWGMFKPVAPKGWDAPGANVIVADKSTTRYVVLMTDGKKQLHPVLNMASARLLLDAGNEKVVTVKEQLLDESPLHHGPTIGIPYAPDRLPDKADAAVAKRWAVCERPGQGARSQRATFVLAEREEKETEGRERVRGGQLLYVEGPAPEKTRYVVDAGGTAYPLQKTDELLLRQVVGHGRVPQKVSGEWLATLHQGDPIKFPRVPGTVGGTSSATDQYKVGTILQANEAGREEQHYLVLADRIAPVSDFMAKLLLNSEQLAEVGQHGNATEESGSAITGLGAGFGSKKELNWPQADPSVVNEAETTSGSRNTVCSVLRGVDGDSGRTTLSTWAGTSYPKPLANGGSSAYVTPGSGLLYRQVKGSDMKSGFLFLVTDTGLRYAMQSNGDTSTDDAGIGESGSAKEREAARQEAAAAQERLGYKTVDPVPVPAEWSTFLPTGPRLSTGAARQPQGS
ncbi:type VII secretion protein EccB [Streptomyces sp. NPDC050418]|uniref:type VII secretion protein EccB n=1 Tax=Streptomyces sp. NPDC050418 TaxID=3365612 RepID=UPI003798A30E